MTEEDSSDKLFVNSLNHLEKEVKEKNNSEIKKITTNFKKKKTIFIEKPSYVSENYSIRRESRILALQALFAYDIQSSFYSKNLKDKKNINEVVELITTFSWRDKKPPKVISFAKELTLGTIERMEAIDNSIKDKLRNWEMDRIFIINKSILRLAVYQMFYIKSIIPKSIVIDESIILAKIFGDKESKDFINGLLDNLDYH